ncbi:MAG: glucokinase [Rubellimicrobium sp.]|nr:glucokinase [Rubellimicrobium sp.]
MTRPAPLVSVVADIGGTNTRVALARGATIEDGSLRHFRNADHPGLEPILAQFVAGTGLRPDACCVAVAGPVQDGRADMTNIAWSMSEDSISRATGAARAVLLNDLQAQGHALGHLAGDRLVTAVEGPLTPGAPMLVVGLGTGVNAAPVHGSGAGRLVPPSECGHVSLPVRDEADLALLRHIEAIPPEPGRTRRASVEEALSGRGLVHLHGFHASRSGGAPLADAHGVLAALAAGEASATAAVADYVRILGQVLGDLALVHLPFGGIHLIGGMARAIMPHFARFGLTARFRAPRWIDLLEHEFRVIVVDDDSAALTGCAAHLVAGQEGGAAPRR